MKTLVIILIASFLICSNLIGQESGTKNEMANKSKMDNSITATKKDAVMMQRITSQDRTENWNELFNNKPERGFIVFDTDVNDYFFFNGKAWEQVIYIERDINGNKTSEKSLATNERIKERPNPDKPD